LPSARLVVYSEAIYAANNDRLSQIGHIISLVDQNDIYHLLAYSSKKSPRVVTSICSGEAIALALAFTQAYTMQYYFAQMTGNDFSIHLRTDSLAVFDAILKKTVPKYHRLLIDIAQFVESGCVTFVF
jgi:hypothetical protein